jgi:hypothetical protein
VLFVLASRSQAAPALTQECVCYDLLLTQLFVSFVCKIYCYGVYTIRHRWISRVNTSVNLKATAIVSVRRWLMALWMPPREAIDAGSADTQSRCQAVEPTPAL